MIFEYLLFDLLVFLPPLALSMLPAANFRHRVRTVLIVVAIAALPFIVWDAVVAGDHWHFNPRYVLGLELGGLPVEEVLFFFAVPYACLFTWETVLRGERSRIANDLAWIHPLSWILVPLGLTVAWLGPAYTGLALLAFGSAAVLDHALGTFLLRQPRYFAFLVVVTLLNLVFNGYLTGRPIVLYSEHVILGLRIGSVPVEDLVYGAALLTTSAVGYQWAFRRRPAQSWLARLIELGLGGYRQNLVVGNPTLPTQLADTSKERRTVGIVGGGLAGLSAAAVLADRGFAVTLFERNAYLGGKLASFEVELDDGFETSVEHGFHAFFRHYYNLRNFLERLGVARKMRSIGQYVIVRAGGESIAFDDVREAPVLNLLGLARRGLYRFREVAFGPAGREMEAFLRYDEEKTFRDFDHVSFAEFCERAQLPSRLKTVFMTFSRAFFADADRLSTAELIKSFHFYYLSHDLGLTYDYFPGTLQSSLLEPIERYLLDRGVVIRRGTSVDTLERRDGRLELGGCPFDHVVTASDIGATTNLLRSSATASREAPELVAHLSDMPRGQPYAVLRLWIDRPSPRDLPVFVSTEREIWLDAVAFIDRVEDDARQWALENGGSVIELHCYALPDLAPPDAEIKATLTSELERCVPELRGLRIRHAHLQVHRNFTAFHVGLADKRPGTVTPMEGLYLCGDWVALPCPAMLMEAAHTSALLAANAILQAEGLCEELVSMVPAKGVLARLPARPG